LQFQHLGQFVSLSFLLIVFLSKLFYFRTTLLSYVEFRFAPAFNFLYFIICKKESFFFFLINNCLACSLFEPAE
jgi:hypothetical protein